MGLEKIGFFESTPLSTREKEGMKRQVCSIPLDEEKRADFLTQKVLGRRSSLPWGGGRFFFVGKSGRSFNA